MNSSLTNFNSEKTSEKQMKETRKQLGSFGAKPHLLAKQNEVIQRMIERNSGTYTSGDPLMAAGESKIGGTPKVPKKTNSARRNDSQARVIEKEMVLPKGNTILQQKSSIGFSAPDKTMRSSSSAIPKKEVKRSKSESSISSTELEFDDVADDESNSSKNSKVDPVKRAMLFKPL